MNQEIERKYFIKYIPENLTIEKITEIEQIFIYYDEITLIRLRKQLPIYTKKEKSNYLYTVKTKGDIIYNKKSKISQKYEIENSITKEQYEELKKRQINNQIQKTRIVIPIENDKKAEIDIYKGQLKGLLTAEVEFKNITEAKKFQKPDWFGEELGYKELSNIALSKMTEEEWKGKVTKELILNNKKIIQEFKKMMEFLTN